MTKPTFPVPAYDFYKTNGVDASFSTVGPSMCRQEFAEECDINALMKRYEGHVVGGPGNLGVHPDHQFYADFTKMPKSLLEFHAFMDEAQAAFMSLPAAVRKTMDNDPVQFVDFAQNPANIDQLREWGLAAPKKVAPLPQEVRIVADDRPGADASKPGKTGATHGST